MSRAGLSRRLFLKNAAVVGVAGTGLLPLPNNETALLQSPPKTSSWVHGNALTAENPQNLQAMSHFGWGTDIQLKPGKSCWLHIPVPTPVLFTDVRARLFRVFLLTFADRNMGVINSVVIYDGPNKVQEFNKLSISGDHRNQIDNSNTFNLSTPYVVRYGIGISFLASAPIGFEGGVSASLISLTSAGADFSFG